MRTGGNVFKLCMPWGAGLGTFGLHWGRQYVDFHIQDGRLYMFTAIHENKDSIAVTQRSWYVLTRKGWKLLKQEDRWGRWHHGRHKACLLERPASIPDRAWKLRELFAPYQRLNWYGRDMEVMSFPCPESNSVTLMIREPNNPCTLEEITLEEYIQ